MPEAERSRAYQADASIVWEAAINSLDDVGLALVETEEEHGRIRARAGGSIWDLKGHVLLRPTCPVSTPVSVRPLQCVTSSNSWCIILTMRECQY